MPDYRQPELHIIDINETLKYMSDYTLSNSHCTNIPNNSILVKLKGLGEEP